MMVDLTMMDTASDTSEDSRRAVMQVPARRGRRLRICGTQPIVADLHTPNRFSALEEIRNTAATVSDELSDTVSEANVSENRGPGTVGDSDGDSDGDSSGDDSVLIEREGFRDVVDEEALPHSVE